MQNKHKQQVRLYIVLNCMESNKIKAFDHLIRSAFWGSTRISNSHQSLMIRNWAKTLQPPLEPPRNQLKRSFDVPQNPFDLPLTPPEIDFRKILSCSDRPLLLTSGFHAQPGPLKPPNETGVHPPSLLSTQKEIPSVPPKSACPKRRSALGLRIRC